MSTYTYVSFRKKSLRCLILSWQDRFKVKKKGQQSQKSQ